MTVTDVLSVGEKAHEKPLHKELQATQECREWEKLFPGKSTCLVIQYRTVSPEIMPTSNIRQTEQAVIFTNMCIYIYTFLYSCNN